MATAAQLEAWLAESQAARHKLATGSKEESVTFADGRQVRYSQTDLSRLDSYIADLKRQLGKADGGYKPVPVVFG